MKVVYEDRDLLVVYKEAGMAVQSRNVTEMDLESLLRNHLAKRDGEEAAKRLFVVHRLDQPVSGLLVFARTKEAAASLSAQVQDGRMKKIYHARVSGKIPADAGVLEDYLIREAGGNRSRVVEENEKSGKAESRGNPVLTGNRKGKTKGAKLTSDVIGERRVDGAKLARLAYRKIGEDLLEIELFTGRYHQIRVQLAHAGMPIVGDCKYGDPAQRGRLELAAVWLEFEHPRTRKKMKFSWNENEEGK